VALRHDPQGVAAVARGQLRRSDPNGTVPSRRRVRACARSPGCSSGHQRAASAVARGSQESANQAMVRWASGRYCAWGWSMPYAWPSLTVSAPWSGRTTLPSGCT
jgi:hypothetical protein